MNRHELAKREKAFTHWAFVNIPEVLEVNSSKLKGEKSWLTLSGIIDWDKYELYTNIYRAGDSERYRIQKFVDQKAVNVYQKRLSVFRGKTLFTNTTELIEDEELRHYRNDIPDIITYFEQGLQERTSEWMDGDTLVKIDQRELAKQGRKLLSDGKQAVGVMNDRDFRERCVVVGNTLQAVQDVTGVEDLRIMHKPEWLQTELDCDFEDAVTIATAFTRLGISRGIAYRIINGYWDNVWKPGLKNIGRSRGAHYAEYFESLCKDLDNVIDESELTRQYYYDVSQKMVESGDWCLQYGTHEVYWNDQMRYIEESVLLADGNDQLQVIDINIDEAEGFVDHFGDEELEPTLNVTQTWRLYNGSETLDHDTICLIKNANFEEIGIIIKKMYPQGRAKAEWGYNEKWWLSGWMTESQTKQAWWYINDVRAKLAKESKSHLTKESKVVLMEAKKMQKKRARAYIATYCAGNTFDLNGKAKGWKHVPDVIEKYAVWAEFNAYMS